MFVPIGAALAATTAVGRVFDFRADILLLLGGAFLMFALFLAPVVFRLELALMTKGALLLIAAVLVTYGIIVTVLPNIWTPFHARFTMPQIGWKGVFSIAIAFDLIAALLAFFVLKRLKAPQLAGAEVEAKVEVPGAA
jgi:hypothetical protein